MRCTRRRRSIASRPRWVRRTEPTSAIAAPAFAKGWLEREGGSAPDTELWRGKPMTAWVLIRNLDFGAILAVPFSAQVDEPSVVGICIAKALGADTLVGSRVKLPVATTNSVSIATAISSSLLFTPSSLKAEGKARHRSVTETRQGAPLPSYEVQDNQLAPANPICRHAS